MKNHYEVSGEVTIIFLNSNKHRGLETIIDTADLQRAKEIAGSWYPLWSPSGKTFYVYGKHRTYLGKWITVKLHRWLIPNCSPELLVDHANHNTLDNRRSVNLRLCTKSENLANQRKKKGFTSKYKGVNWKKENQKYQAQINVSGEKIYLGLFHSEIEAAKAYNKAALKHFGEFAKLNKIGAA